MTYKTDLINIVKYYLVDKYGRKKASQMLGGWNDPSRKAQRQSAIDESIEGIKVLIDRQEDYNVDALKELMLRLDAIDAKLDQANKPTKE